MSLKSCSKAYKHDRPQSSETLRTHEKPASFRSDKNRPPCSGTGGRLPSESVAGISGIRNEDHPIVHGLKSAVRFFYGNF